MIIDFHTHIFPDKIAEKTISFLASKSGFTPFTDGTVSGLVRALEDAEADVAVTLPVLTDPKQFDSVNRFAKTVNEVFEGKSRRLISFGGIHPACDDIEGKMAYIKESGFLGVKIHPDYQDTDITDDGYIRILQCAKKYDLIVVTHSGVDGGYRDRPIRCTPKMAKEVIHKVDHGKFVLAHYGANELWEETLDVLCGENVYFDTAFTLRYISPALFKDILCKHGEDKILFATDCPWRDIVDDVKILKSYNLDSEIYDKLFYKNVSKKSRENKRKTKKSREN